MGNSQPEQIGKIISYLCPMKSLFLLISSPFCYTFFKFGNIKGLNKAGMKADVASRRVEARMKERDPGVRVVR